jgi:hypothetical protein
MLDRSLVALLVATVSACGTSDAGDALPSPAPFARSVDAQRDPPAPQVFVELKIVDVVGDPRDPSVLLDRSSFDDVTLGKDVTLIVSPNLLAPDHTVAELRTDLVGVTVKPDIRADESVRLDLAISSNDAAARSWQTSIIVPRDQTILVGATRDHDRARLVAVRATVVRSQADLRQVFERRMREHAAKQRRARTLDGRGAAAHPGHREEEHPALSHEGEGGVASE